MNVVFMKVSGDKYSLPECIADSVRELADRLGIKPSSIYESMSRSRHDLRQELYCRVEIGDDEDDDDDDWEDEIYND